MGNRNPVLELQNAVRKSVCNGSLKKDYPLLLEQCRKDGISSYILNLFIVTAQAKLKNSTGDYVKYHPKELEKDSIETEKIKFVEKIPLRYRAYKILFFSLLFVIVALWIGRSCGCTDNQGGEVAFGSTSDSAQSANSSNDNSSEKEQKKDSVVKFAKRTDGGYVKPPVNNVRGEERRGIESDSKVTAGESVVNTSESSKKGSYVGTPKSKDELFEEAKRNNNYSTMKTLADQGYVKAYLPLAQHYFKNTKTHSQAEKYALKAQQAGVTGADKILEELELLDY